MRPSGLRHEGCVLAVCACCDDTVAALVFPHNGTTKVTGLYCFNCNEYVPLYRGYLAANLSLVQRLALSLSRLTDFTDMKSRLAALSRQPRETADATCGNFKSASDRSRCPARRQRITLRFLRRTAP